VRDVMFTRDSTVLTFTAGTQPQRATGVSDM